MMADGASAFRSNETLFYLKKEGEPIWLPCEFVMML